MSTLSKRTHKILAKLQKELEEKKEKELKTAVRKRERSSKNDH